MRCFAAEAPEGDSWFATEESRCCGEDMLCGELEKRTFGGKDRKRERSPTTAAHIFNIVRGHRTRGEWTAVRLTCELISTLQINSTGPRIIWAELVVGAFGKHRVVEPSGSADAEKCRLVTYRHRRVLG